MNAKDLQVKTAVIRWVDPRLFGLVLVPVVVFVSNVVIKDHFMPADLYVPPEILQEGRHWLEASGRYRVLAATWFFAALAVLAAAILVRNLARPTASETRYAALATWLFVTLLAVMPTVQAATNPDAAKVYDSIGGALFEAVLSRGSLPGCDRADATWLLGRCGDLPVVTLFDRLIDIVNVLAGIAVGSLIVGMILCLDARACKDTEEEAELLAVNLRQMRLQLYMSSLILTFGMFFATSWMHWPLMSVLEAERPAYGSLVMSASLYMGTYFSLLILSFYLPVAILLDGRVRRLAARVRGETTGAAPMDIDEWRAAHGLKDGVTDLLRIGFALTAPVLTAFAGGASPF